MSSHSIKGKTVAFLVTDGFEQVELTKPWKAVEEAGGTPVLVSPKKKGEQVQGMNHFEKADKFDVDQCACDAEVDQYEALVLPGGVANPDTLRTCPDSVKFVRGFFKEHKPVAAICHGPWTLIEARVVDGRKVTSWPSLKTDLINAGANWVDEECVCDEGLVTSRNPDDLPAFCDKLIEEVAEGKHKLQTA